jgi:hypothetical protein
LVVSLVAVVAAAGMVLGGQAAYAGKKPETAPPIVITMDDVLISSFVTEPPPQPVLLSGRLNVVLSANGASGQPPRLHVNLMHGVANSADGSVRFVAVGSADALPIGGCASDGSCSPARWTVTLALVHTPAPTGPVPIPYPNLQFTLTVQTTYWPDGTLATAGLVSEIIE